MDKKTTMHCVLTLAVPLSNAYPSIIVHGVLVNLIDI